MQKQVRLSEQRVTTVCNENWDIHILGTEETVEFEIRTG
jgi:hypothetical protein